MHNATLQASISERDAKYFLLRLDAAEQKVYIQKFAATQSQQANDLYIKAETEAEGKNIQVVLVSAESISALKRAYPNYFMDTKRFSEVLSDTLRS